MKKTQPKFIIAFLILLAIILFSLLLARVREDAAATLSYRVGSPVTPSTELPIGMTLKTFAVPSGEPIPTIAFDLIHDSMGGWDVHVATANFTFAPEHLNGAPVAGEGHVHLYIDNNLIIMLAPWYHIDSLAPGNHSIRVGLFNNDHSAYTVNGVRIEADKQITSSSAASAKAAPMSGM